MPATTTATSQPTLSFAISIHRGAIIVHMRVAGTTNLEHALCVSHREQPDDKTAVSTREEANQVMQFFKVRMNGILAQGKSIAEYAYLTWLYAYGQWEDASKEEIEITDPPTGSSSNMKKVHFQDAAPSVPTASPELPPQVGEKRLPEPHALALLVNKKSRTASPTPPSSPPILDHTSYRLRRRCKSVNYSVKKMMEAQLGDVLMSSDVEVGDDDDSQVEDGYRPNEDSDTMVEDVGMEGETDVFGACGPDAWIHDWMKDSDEEDEDEYEEEQEEVAGGGTWLMSVEKEEEDELADDYDELEDMQDMCPGTPGQDNGFDLQNSQSYD